MSFALWMIGFLIVMAVVVWAAVFVGVPQLYLAIAVLAVLCIAVAAAVRRSRTGMPSSRR